MRDIHTARDIDEPVVARGPFVMITGEEISEACNGCRQGKFGLWKE